MTFTLIKPTLASYSWIANFMTVARIQAAIRKWINWESSDNGLPHLNQHDGHIQFDNDGHLQANASLAQNLISSTPFPGEQCLAKLKVTADFPASTNWDLNQWISLTGATYQDQYGQTMSPKCALRFGRSSYASSTAGCFLQLVTYDFELAGYNQFWMNRQIENNVGLDVLYSQEITIDVTQPHCYELEIYYGYDATISTESVSFIFKIDGVTHATNLIPYKSTMFNFHEGVNVGFNLGTYYNAIVLYLNIYAIEVSVF